MMLFKGVANLSCVVVDVCRPLPGGPSGIASSELEFPSLLQFLGLVKTDHDGDERMESDSATAVAFSICDAFNW